MKKEDLEYIKGALEYALNDYTPSPQMAETHFNTFQNAISLVEDELHLLAKPVTVDFGAVRLAVFNEVWEKWSIEEPYEDFEIWLHEKVGKDYC